MKSAPQTAAKAPPASAKNNGGAAGRHGQAVISPLWHPQLFGLRAPVAGGSSDAAATPVRGQSLPARVWAAGTGQAGSAAPAPQRKAVATMPAVLQRKKAASGDELPDDLDVNWDGDAFTLVFDHAQMDGSDVLKVSVRYRGRFGFDGPFVRDKTIVLWVDIGPRPLKVQLTEGDAAVTLDLYGDATQKVQLVDRFASQAGKGRNHDLALRQLGRTRFATSTWVLDPSAKADPVPDPAAAAAADLPGERPVTSLRFEPGGVAWVMRVDGDGDQYKELLLTLRAAEFWPDAVQKDIPKQLQVTARQISSGKQQATSFTLPKPAMRGSLFPQVTEVSDGQLPTVVDLELPSNTALLQLRPPTAAGAEIAYELSAAGQSQLLKFPPEKAGLHAVASADAPKVVGGIASVDVTLGAYGDRFRLTVQPLPYGLAIFGVSMLYGGEPDSGRGTLLRLPRPPRLAVLEQGGLHLALDLDGDGKPDLTLFDRLDSPRDGSGNSNPESDRNHQIRLVGPSVGGGQTVFEAAIRRGQPMGAWGSRPNATDMAAASNAQAVTSLPKQTSSFESDLDRIEIALQNLRRDAKDAALISQATYESWLALSKAMIQLRAEQSVKVSPATQARAAAAAGAFYQALKVEVATANRIQFHQAGSSVRNDYTGMRESNIAGMGTRASGYGPELEWALRAGQWADATSDYNQLVDGLDRWIAERLHQQSGRGDAARNAKYLGAAKTALGGIESKRPIRIQAVFHPEEEFLASGRITEMPLALYYWRDGSTWHLADLTNPLNTFEDTLSANAADKAPPPALFAKLDARIHFPKGVIHYQIVGGEAGNFRTTATTSWTDYLAYIGLGAAVVGLTLATFGTGTVAVAGAWVLAGSGLITAAGTTAEMIEKWRHGNLDATTAVIDIAQIVASLAGAAALSSVRIVVLAGGAVRAGAPWAGNWARLAVMADRLFVPLAGTKVAADVITGVALTTQTAAQLDAVEHGSGTRAAKDRAKALLLSQAVLSLGMLSLSVKGELGNIKAGRQLILYYPPEEAGLIKPPVALIGDQVAPGALKFSQKDIKAVTGEGQTIEDLTSSMKKGGWRGNPLEVVEMPDGSKVSLDNRRLVAAQNAGLKEVPIAVHDAADKLPADQRARFQLKDYAIRRLDSGELVTGGNKGSVVYPKGSLPVTYEEAALFRTADQGNLGGGKGKFPLMGRAEQPTIRAVKPGPAPPGEVE